MKLIEALKRLESQGLLKPVGPALHACNANSLRQTKHKLHKIKILGLILIHTRKQTHLFSSGGLLAIGRFTEHWPKIKHGKQFER